MSVFQLITPDMNFLFFFSNTMIIYDQTNFCI